MYPRRKLPLLEGQTGLKPTVKYLEMFSFAQLIVWLIEKNRKTQ